MLGSLGPGPTVTSQRSRDSAFQVVQAPKTLPTSKLQRSQIKDPSAETILGKKMIDDVARLRDKNIRNDRATVNGHEGSPTKSQACPTRHLDTGAAPLAQTLKRKAGTDNLGRLGSSAGSKMAKTAGSLSVSSSLDRAIVYHPPSSRLSTTQPPTTMTPRETLGILQRKHSTVSSDPSTSLPRKGLEKDKGSK